MFKVTCLIDPRRTVGTPRKFGLEGPRTTVPVQHYLSQANIRNHSKNATNMCYMNAQKERGSDSKNFGTRISGFAVVVEKI
jgi:hypothetical protein